MPDREERVERLSIRSVPKRIRDARGWFARVARAHGCSEDEVRDLAVALSEACSNAQRHGYEGRDDGPIELELRIRSDEIELSVRDYGKGLEPGSYRAPDLARPRVGGYGIYLMSQLTDRVEHRPAETGTLVVMMKSRSRKAEVEHVG